MVVTDPASSMLAQQLGRPLEPNKSGLQEQSSAGSHGAGVGVAPGGVPIGVHQELPDNVAAELEKLEQESGDPAAEGDGSELADLGLADDDELLGMGADFNILEYADP